MARTIVLLQSQGIVLQINEDATLDIYYKTLPQTLYAAILDGVLLNNSVLSIRKQQNGSEAKIGAEPITNTGQLTIGKME